MTAYTSLNVESVEAPASDEGRTVLSANDRLWRQAVRTQIPHHPNATAWLQKLKSIPFTNPSNRTWLQSLIRELKEAK